VQRFGVRNRRPARGANNVSGTDAAASTGQPHISGYTDLAVIGHGASATVYRALQEGFDRWVALKVLNVDISDRRAQKRFQRERSVNGRLSNHPNVVTVLDSGFVDGRHPYLAMELLEHGSLADRLVQRGPFDVALTLHIGVRIAGALESAHRLGILHRDVKPQNILLSRFGEPALADFGIATILEMEHSLTAALTPVHAAPEVLEGADPTAQTDVYALGSTLFTLLAGSAPFVGPPGEGMLAQLLRITTSDVPPMPRADVPRALIELLRSSMAKRPIERIGTAGAFGEELQRVQTGLGLAVTPLPVDVPEVVAAPDDADAATGAVEPFAAGGSPAPSTATSAVAESLPLLLDHVPPPPPARQAPPMLPPPVMASSPGPAPAGAPVIDHDRTVGIVIDSPTIVGRQRPPALPEIAPKRPRWILPAIVIGALSVGGAGALAIARAVGRSDGTKASTPSVTSSPVGSAPVVDPAAVAPTNLSTSIADGAVYLRWKDNSNGLPQFVFVYRVGQPKGESQQVQRNAQSHIVKGVESSAQACFIVAVVISVGVGTAPARTANSNVACINGAVSTEVTTP
jgi:serine/threonine-protein kinase PknK